MNTRVFCPHCTVNSDFIDGACSRCGFRPFDQVMAINSPRPHFTDPRIAALVVAPERSLMRGDIIRQGRYHLIEQLSLPKNQQDQGIAWFASDLQHSRRPVILRRIAFPNGIGSNRQEIVRTIAKRFEELAQQHSGFPKVIEIFNEYEEFYLVLSSPVGESLTRLIKRQGGALPEREVIEYGLQVCNMLTCLASYNPPLVHGAISPETLVISRDKKQVFLLHLPLFPPDATKKGNELASYQSPEQIRGKISPAEDIYSLAATLHHAVTGYDPRERLAFFYPPARRLNPVVTSQMETILMQGLRLSQSVRFASPDAMGRALSHQLKSPSLPTTSPSHVAFPLSLRISQEKIQQRNNLRAFSIVGAVSISIILIFLVTYLFSLAGNKNKTNVDSQAMTSTQQSALYQSAYTQELKAEMQLYHDKGIGISDGRFAFDTYQGRVDSDLKKQAAAALQQGNTSSAIDLLTKATSADVADGEAQIYNENLHVQQSNTPFITIVLGLAIDNSASDLSVSRNDMEAAFLAQRDINANNKLPHGLRLRLLIDNSGADNANVATVAQFVASRVSKTGNLDHIVGVVGWPFSSQTINARDIIASAHLPLISQTASSVKLSGGSPYFFRVNPPDDLQGATLGDFAIKQFQAKTVLILRDPTDPYSVSLANAFSDRLKSLNGTPIDDPANNFTETTTTVETYQKTAIASALKNGVSLIFIAGLDVDAIRLAHALGNFSRLYPNSAFLTNLQILGGDGIGTNLLLGQGDGPDAAIAATYSQDMQRLNFTAFAHPDEWSFLKPPLKQQPSFFANWSDIYRTSAQTPGTDAILTYDAVQVLTNAVTLVSGSLTGQSLHDALTSIGRKSVPPFQGVSGRILFDDQGNPQDKALVVLSITPQDGQNTITLKQIAGTFR